MPNSKRPSPAPGNRTTQARPDAKGTQSSREVDAQALLHELRVHQVELEVQNEELRRARSEMELALGRYTELFDFAPIGYATVQADSTVTEVNYAGAQILGLVRATVCGMRFERLVLTTHRGAFSERLAAARACGEKQVLQLELLRFGGEPVAVRLSLIPLTRTDPMILVAFENWRP